jgi:predicted enzyme related to lactoylglutathione lyase
MPDPFEALRVPPTPVQPDPAFAARLRQRLARTLGISMEPSMTNQTLEPQVTTSGPTASILTPYLSVADARRALAWYADVFGARQRGEPIVMPDGRIGHAELDFNGALLYLADDFPEIHLRAPVPGGDIAVSLQMQVPEVDRLTERAVRAGATLERPPAEQPYGRSSVVRDPFGHRWMLTALPAAPAGAEPLREGDIGYVSLWVPDAPRAAAFFEDVLGWQFAPVRDEQTRQVANTALSHGLVSLGAVESAVWGTHTSSTLFVCFCVDDVDSAVERVRAAGGRAEQPHEEPYGRIANCVDDQGLPFALYTPPPGARPSRTTISRGGAGDIAYITIEVPDADRTRTFFDSVLGWRFTPGRTPGGWNVEDVVPMSGMSGGHDAPRVIPMYQVDHIEAAVARVRAAGGRATNPVRAPYGLTSTCTDDQDTRFYLGQF